MSNITQGNRTDQILISMKNNWRSGLTVALVALPLSISLAVASGTTPTIGIITTLWAGLFASIFGGSNYNIVGPTGALSGLIAAYALMHGAESLWTLSIIAGFFILLAYYFKLERYLIFIPKSVVVGFTLGVAFIIAFNQLDFALGLYDLPKHTRLFGNIIESVRNISLISFPTLIVSGLFFIALGVSKNTFPKIPAVLLLTPFGIALGFLCTKGYLPIHLATLGTVFTDTSFKFYVITGEFALTPSLFSAGAAVALVAILETMLSAKIADNATGTKHDERKEMLGLGLANLASGIMGGIPATAALARTSLNIRSGATEKISATLSTIFLCIIAFFFLQYFKFIPMPVIAAILVFVAVQMVELSDFKSLYRHERSSFWVALAVALVTFFEDPIIGILFGTATALLIFVEKVSRGQYEISFNTKKDGLIKTLTGETFITGPDADVLLYSMNGKLSYINSRSHVDRFSNALKKYPTIIIRLRGINYIDIEGIEALDEILAGGIKNAQTYALTGISPHIEGTLSALSPHFERLKKSGLIFNKSEDALRHFGIPI